MTFFGYLCTIYLSIYLSIHPSIPFFVGATGHISDTILMHNGSNDVFSQTLVPFGVLMTHFNI